MLSLTDEAGTDMLENAHIRFVVPGDDPPQLQGSSHLDRLVPSGEVKLFTDLPANMEDQMERVRGAQVILNTRSSVKWSAEALRSLPELRMISVCSIGTDNIDVQVATELEIIVSNQPGRTAGVVAEHTIGLMFAVAKLAAFQTTELRAGRWGRAEAVFLQGKTLGVIGVGNIGREVARLGNALGMRVIAWTFSPPGRRAEELGIEFVELDDLFRRSDVVTPHVRLTDDTRGMIGRREIGLMKPGSLLVNCGRGELLDTPALVEALNSRHLGGAALDVFDVEPLPPNHPILSCEHVVLTPHMADQTPEGIELLNEGVVDNAIAFLEGRPRNVVTG